MTKKKKTYKGKLFLDKYDNYYTLNTKDGMIDLIDDIFDDFDMQNIKITIEEIKKTE